MYAKILIPLLCITTGSSVLWALSIEQDPKVLVEQQNQKALRECLKKAINESSSDAILQAKRDCNENLLSEVMTYSGQLISGTGLLTPSSEPPSKIDDKISILHQNVCEKQINSPLCKDRKLFDRLYQLTEERLPGKNFYPILLGITNAESSLGLNFAKDRIGGTCADRNNWGGIKWKINDDGSRQKDQPIPDQYGCYLYKFYSIEEYWISKVNTVRFGYKGCVDHATPIRCMSYAYVGDRNVAEESWIKNVSIFLQ